MNVAIDDLRSAIWQLRVDWRFATAAIVCLGLGIAAVASIFSVLSQIIFSPFPFPDADRLVMVRGYNAVLSRFDDQISEPDFYDLQTATTTMDVAAYKLERLDLPHENGFHRIHGFYVSDNFFDVLQMQPYLGGTYSGHRETGAIKQLMLGTNVWRQYFQSRPDIIGEVIRVNTWETYPKTGDRGYNVVGLLPQGMPFLPSTSFMSYRGLGPNRKLQFCAPLNAGFYGFRSWRSREVIGRLKDGVSAAQANAEVQLIADRLAREFPDSNKDWSMRVVPLDRHVYGSAREILYAGLIASVVVLVIACGNVAHLMLIRFIRRQSDLAVRAALGATPTRLGRVALFESAIIVGLAALLSGSAAVNLVKSLDRVAPRELSHVEAEVDSMVAITTCSLSLACVLAITLLTQHRLRTPNLKVLLSSSNRTSSAGASSTRLLRTLVVLQVGVAYILLVAAGMLVARQLELASVELGFQPDHRLTVNISLPEAKHEWKRNTTFCHDVMRATKTLPGVVNVAAVQGLPMGDNRLDSDVIIEGHPLLRRHDIAPAFMRVVTDDYFATMGIPIIHGRAFQYSDGIGEIGLNRTVIVSEALARRCWPGENPIGRRMKGYELMPWQEVIGVVGNVRANGVETDNTLEVYLPERLFPQPFITLIVHTKQESLGLASEVREVVHKIDPDAFVNNAKTMRQVIGQSQARPRYLTILLSAFALLGLVLAAVGVFVTSAFSVARRKHELRIRAACGATPWDLVGLVMSRELTTVLCGIVVGLVVAIFLNHQFDISWKTSGLFRLAAFAVVPGVLILASVAASLGVALKAAFERR